MTSVVPEKNFLDLKLSVSESRKSFSGMTQVIICSTDSVLHRHMKLAWTPESDLRFKSSKGVVELELVSIQQYPAVSSSVHVLVGKVK